MFIYLKKTAEILDWCLVWREPRGHKLGDRGGGRVRVGEEGRALRSRRKRGICEQLPGVS